MKRIQWILIGSLILAFCSGILASLTESTSWVIGAMFLFVFAAPSFACVIKEKGIGRGLFLILGLGLFAYIIESLAVKFGFPYGYFFYSGKMGPSPFDLAPILTPLAWTPLVLGAFAVMTRLKFTDLKWIFGSAVFLAAVDLLIDPGAIAQGLWNYRNGGFLYGMPLSNISGWLFSASAASFLFRRPIESTGPLIGLLWILAFWIAVAVVHVLVLPAVVGILLFAFVVKLLFTRI